MRHIRSMYYTNIPWAMRDMQAKAIAALGHQVVQENATGMPHGQWLTKTLETLGEADCILFLDIDCIPLDRGIVDEAFRAAESGRIFAVAQAAMHLDSDFVYASPVFLCVSRRTWDALGNPSMMPDERFDAGGRLTAQAQFAGVPVDLMRPTFAVVPKWHQAELGDWGIGTFYGSHVFHLYESRLRVHGTLFADVAHCVIDGRPIDYASLARQTRSFKTKVANLRGYLARRAWRIRRSILKRLPGRTG